MRRVVVCAVLLGAIGAEAQEIGVHQVRLDGGGKLLSWVTPQEQSYDRVIDLAFTFFVEGPPTYLAYPMFDGASRAGLGEVHHPAGLFAMFVDTAARGYAYSGDRRGIERAVVMMDRLREHGSTAPAARWARVPYATSAPGADVYGGFHPDGAGVIEPDKVAEAGHAYLVLHQITGEARFLDAAIACANALVANVRGGDAARSPWPFRVVAETGEVREEYTANVTGALQLFDGLVAAGAGDVEGYRRVRAAVWAWVLAVPMTNGHWSGVFEDIPPQTDPAANPTQYIPLKLAHYLLEHPEVDPAWRAHSETILAWVEARFASMEHGAPVIFEQAVWPVRMGNHTARYATVNALYAERTGDAAAREKAFRAYNWATYVCGNDGICRTGVDPGGGEQIWYATGYADYVRLFLAGMGAVPAFAPPGEDHVLRTSSPVTEVAYAAGEVRYVTSGPSSDVVRVSFEPRAAEGQTVEALGGGDYVVRVTHPGGVVVVHETPSGCFVGGGSDGWWVIVVLGLRRRPGRLRAPRSP